jgi:hypothetical protein
MNWKEIKAEVLENCSKAGITDKGFIKTILLVERRVLTTRKLMQKISWESVCYSQAYNQAARALELLNGGAGGNYRNGVWVHWSTEPEFAKLYFEYCKVTGICFDAYLGDWLA